MVGAQNNYRGNVGGGSGILVTVGTDTTFDPKSGNGINQWGYASAANSVNGGTVGARSPTTLLGATINGIFEYDIYGGSTSNLFKLVLNGNQTALSITSATVNGHTFTFGAPAFAGGQTTWVAGGWGANPFGGATDTVVFS